MIDVKFPIKVKDLAKVVDQANVNPHTMDDNKLIANDNRLIAEFMGYDSYEFRGHTMFIYEEDNHRTDIDLHYHTSWEWLMPVVDTINDYTNDKGYAVYSVEIDTNHVTIRRGLDTAIVVDRPQADSYMEMIYLAVAEFARRFHQYGQSL